MTDQHLQLVLAKMLPEKIEITFENKVVGNPHSNRDWYFDWLDGAAKRSVLDTEWDHICYLVEQTLTRAECVDLDKLLEGDGEKDGTAADFWWHISWQQRAEALCKVKGIAV